MEIAYIIFYHTLLGIAVLIVIESIAMIWTIVSTRIKTTWPTYGLTKKQIDQSFYHSFNKWGNLIRVLKNAKTVGDGLNFIFNSSGWSSSKTDEVAVADGSSQVSLLTVKVDTKNCYCN